MKTVQILGAAPNLSETPLISGAERWGCNNPRVYRIRFPEALHTCTRWFNFHTTSHIKARYLGGYNWYTKQSIPIYLQAAQPDIPTSLAFPRQVVQEHFGTPLALNKFFNCSASWLIAFAIIEGFERIELWGFELRRDKEYDWERPCFFYWVDQAKRAGVDVFIPPGVDISEPGDPSAYDGPLYGYEPHNAYYAKYF